MNRIIKLVFVLLLLNCFTFVIDNQGKQKNYFELDVVSAATDGSDCTDPSWIGCSVGWLEKGYVYDKTKGYYVKSSSTTTKPATTTKIVTTKAATNVVSTSSVTTVRELQKTSKPIDTVTSRVTEIEKEIQAPGETKATYTVRSRKTAITSATTTKEVKTKIASPIPITWIVGGVIAIIIMIIEFFVVRSIYKKD